MHDRIAIEAPVRRWPDVEHLTVEDDTPVDGRFTTHEMRLLVDTLVNNWHGPNGDDRFVCDTNVGVFPTVNEPPLVPDFFLSVDVTWPQPVKPKQNRVYFVEAFGKPPDLVVEIVSNDEGFEETTRFEGYERMRVPYYVIHDPYLYLTAEPLRIFKLVEGRFQRYLSNWLPEIGLGLALWTGKFEDMTDNWLRFTDAAGRLIPLQREANQTLERRAEAARAESRLFEQQAALALAEQQRLAAQIEQLQAQIRALKGETNGQSQ